VQYSQTSPVILGQHLSATIPAADIVFSTAVTELNLAIQALNTIISMQPVNTFFNMQRITEEYKPATKEYKLCGYKYVPTERWVHTNCLVTCIAIDQTFPYVTTYHYYMMERSTNQVSSPSYMMERSTYQVS